MRPRRAGRRHPNCLTALVCLAWICAAAAPCAAQTSSQSAAGAAPEDARRAIERIADRGRYQMELPQSEPKPPPPPRERSDFELGTIGQVLLYLILAAAVIFIIATVMGQKIAPARKGAVRKPAPGATVSAPRAPSAAELADAEALALAEAEAGRYDIAIHLLLLGAIGRLRERDARSTARSLTSREILTRAFRGPEDGEARAALRALVTAVEISRFGGRAADRAGFETCLSAYRALRRAIGSGGEALVAAPATAPQTA